MDTDENRYRARMRQHCAAKPDAVEDHPWGPDDSVYKIRGKGFAFIGPPDRATVSVKPHPDEREALLALPCVQPAPYIGRYGWVLVTVSDEDSLALALEQIDYTYDQLAARGRKSKK
ncbi:MAG: MmcQ/YjbR family DNA-binding protein [Armatimonadota bacterium]